MGKTSTPGPYDWDVRRTARLSRDLGSHSDRSVNACFAGAAHGRAADGLSVEPTIEGNRALPESVLALCWAPLSGATFADATRALDVLDDEIARASEAIERLYLDAGFAAVRQAEPRLVLSTDRRRLHVTFVIDEGERHRVGRVRVRGPATLGAMSIPGVNEGDWFSRRRLEAGLAALRRSWERSTGKPVGVAVEVLADPAAARLDLSVVGHPKTPAMLC